MDDSLVKVFDSVRERAPGSHVLVVNYLSILGPAADSDTADDRAYRHRAELLAERTQAAAERADAHLIDIRTPSLGHPASSPDPWTTDFYLPILRRGYASVPLHPTPAGMEAIARLIVEKLQELTPITSAQADTV